MKFCTNFILLINLLTFIVGTTGTFGNIFKKKFQCSCNTAAEKLGSYNVKEGEVTVSGFSSGGAMAMQFHFIFSKFLKAAAILSGTPYLCAEFYDQPTVCRPRPDLIDIQPLIWRASALSHIGLIDNVDNIDGQKVFIYHGQNDTFIPPLHSKLILKMYEHFGANVVTNFRFEADHGMITTNYGATCGQDAAGTHYITDCDYDGAFHALNYINDGDLIHPKTITPNNLDLIGTSTLLANAPHTSSLLGLHSHSQSLSSLIQQLQHFPEFMRTNEFRGELLRFDQNEFFSGGFAPAFGMNETGYIYIPSRCDITEQKRVGIHTLCKLHVTFHGCLEYTGLVDEIYIRNSGFLEVAEANDIITIFPQTIASDDLGNSEGCWDVWGFADPEFATKNGQQVLAVFNMLKRVLKKSR